MANDKTGMPEAALARLGRYRLLDLTTFRRSGACVTTPVRFAIDGGRILVSLQSRSGKVKRIRGDPRVRVGGHGNTLSFEATIRIVPGDASRTAYDALKRRYRFLTLQRFVMGRRPRQHVMAEITLG